MKRNEGKFEDDQDKRKEKEGEKQRRKVSKNVQEKTMFERPSSVSTFESIPQLDLRTGESLRKEKREKKRIHHANPIFWTIVICS